MFSLFGRRHAKNRASQRRPNPQRFRPVIFESLEGRALLAANAFAVDGVSKALAAGASALVDVPAAFRSQRLSLELSKVAHEYSLHAARTPTKPFAASNPLVNVVGGKVAIQAVPSNSAEELEAALERLGALVTASGSRTVSARVPVQRLRELGGLAELRYATNPAILPLVGNTTTQGDVSILTDDVRSILGLDGTGQKIGVISTSYNANVSGANADVASGDLPGSGNPFGNTTPVQVLPGTPVIFNDEGRAMLQLIHDIAPKAELLFATAGGTEDEFEDAIVALRNAGATVIVDDILFVDEPMFMDGRVAQAADAAIAAGVPYISAAGNSGRVSYEASGFANSGVTRNYGFGNVPLHDFDPSGLVDAFQQITIPANAQLVFEFQWQDPFQSVPTSTQSASRDFDLLLYATNTTTLLAASFADNVGLDPVERFVYPSTPSGVAQTVNVAIGAFNAAAQAGGAKLKYVLHSRVGGLATINQFATSSPTSYGHANAANVLAVGAANARLTPEFGTSPPQLESFSSAGGVPILFNNAGSPIAPVTRQTPDVVGPDNGNTTFFGVDDPNPTYDPDSFPNFAGTSAAAPHVAALVALMRQARPAATPAQLFTTLQNTAINMDVAGYDHNTGWGLVHGLNAAFASFTPSMPDLAASTDNGKFNNDNVTSLSGLTITGTAPPNSFVQVVGSLNTSQQLTGGATTYTFTPGFSSNGVFNMWVRVKPSSSSPDSAYSLNSSTLTIYTDTLATTVPPTAPDLTAASDTGPSSTDNITTDTTPTFTGTGPTGSDVTLIVDGQISVNQRLLFGATVYTLTAPTLAPGWHTFAVRQQGNDHAPTESFFDSPTLSVYIDNGQAPAATITPVSPDPRNAVVGSITITFDRPVSGFDLSDLSLTRNGGASLLPGTATLTSSDSRVFTLAHIADITMASGSYNLTLNYAGSGIQSLASGAAPTAANPIESWTQTNGSFQNPLRYYDVNNDTFINSIDTTILNNSLNSPGGGPLPGSHAPLNPNYLDTNGDGFLSPLDLLLVINHINAGYKDTPPLPDLATSSDNGKFTSDNVTSISSQTITGTAPMNFFVALYRNGFQVQTQQLTGGSTTYSFNHNAQVNNIEVMTVKFKETASTPDSQYSNASPGLFVYTDTLATQAPSTAPDLTAASDTGTSSTDNATTDTTPTFIGTAAAGSMVQLFANGVWVGQTILASGVSNYTITSNPLAPGNYNFTIIAKYVWSAPSSSYFTSPPLPVFIDNGQAPAATIAQVTPDPRNVVVESIVITFDRPVAGFDVGDLSLTRSGGPNKLPGTATLSTSDSRVFTLSHIRDITMAAGAYNLTLNYAGSGIVSAASLAAPSGVNPAELWTQTNATYQNPLRFYDVNNDTLVDNTDVNIVSNAINTHGSGALPGSHAPLNPNYLDVSGDNFLSPLDILLIINFINAGYSSGPY